MTIIITDSTCDLTLQQAQELGIEMLSLSVTFGAETFADKRTITNEEFFRKLRVSDELPKTSLISTGEFIQAFERHAGEGIVVLTLSAKLSGTYHSALLAKNMQERDDIYVVDSGTVSAGLILLLKQAAAMRDSGLNAGQIADSLSGQAEHIRIFAALDTLRYVVKGGRLNILQGSLGAILSLKPIVTIVNGNVKVAAKARGINGAVASMARMISSDPYVRWDLPACFTHAGNLELMRKFAAQLPFKQIDGECYLGSVVGTYSGPGAVAVAFSVS